MSRRSEDERTHISSTRGGTLPLEAGAIVGGQSEAIRPKGVAVHFTEIVCDLTGARVGVLELQDRLVHFSRGSAYLDGATTSAWVLVILLKEAAVGAESGFTSAGRRGLAAGVDVHGEAAVVAHGGLARCVLSVVAGEDF